MPNKTILFLSERMITYPTSSKMRFFLFPLFWLLSSVCFIFLSFSNLSLQVEGQSYRERLGKSCRLPIPDFSDSGGVGIEGDKKKKKKKGFFGGKSEKKMKRESRMVDDRAAIAGIFFFLLLHLFPPHFLLSHLTPQWPSQKAPVDAQRQASTFLSLPLLLFPLFPPPVLLSLLLLPPLLLLLSLFLGEGYSLCHPILRWKDRLLLGLRFRSLIQVTKRRCKKIYLLLLLGR